MGRYTGKSCRLICMLSMTMAFFLVEIVTGYITNSLALVGDSYHMLSDVVALFVGFASVRVSIFTYSTLSIKCIFTSEMNSFINYNRRIYYPFDKCLFSK